MLIELKKWERMLSNFSKINKGKLKKEKHYSLGGEGTSYTIRIELITEGFTYHIEQSASGSDFETIPSFVKFEYINEELINYNLSIYPKSFFERFFNIGKIITGNKIFDRKFGIYSTDKKIAVRLFKDVKTQNLFLNNKFLVFNAQKNKSIITLKSMETKLYEISELQQLLDDFIYILEVINNEKI